MDIQHMSLSDIRPIYLGYDPKKEKWYFYIIKDSVPRFLSYTTYFLFDKGPENVLELKEIPQELETELVEFLSEKFHYEFKKPRKNSRNATSYKCYTSPSPVKSSSVSSPILENPTVESPNLGPRRRRSSNRVEVPQELCKLHESGHDECVGEGRSKDDRSTTPSGVPDGPNLLPVKRVRKVVEKEIVVEPVIVVKVKRGRGRPRKVVETILEPVVVVPESSEGIPAKNTGRKRKAKI